jgi:hypothetical protein
MEHAEPARVFIDRIIYIVSLVTSPQDVDPFLDTLRGITSRIDPSRPLNQADRKRLQALQEELETYLVTREPLRKFTPEALTLQIEQHMQGNVGHKSRTQLIATVTVATLCAMSAALLLPLSNVPQRIQVGGATEFSLLTVGAAWLFWTALPAFKSELRRAFVLICAGVSLLGLSMLEQPVFQIFNLQRFPVVSLIFPLPILVAATLFQAGDVAYTRLLGVKNWWASAQPVIFGAVILSVITWLLPHPPTGESELIHDSAAIIWAWILIMPIASAFLLPQAIRKVPELYKPPIRALFQSILAIIAVVVYQYVLRIVASPTRVGLIAYGFFGCVIVMGLALLRAGYGFNKVSRY